jgi:tetratricopeptide (TPR) repeat protein
VLTLAARVYEASGDRPAAARLLSRAIELDDTYLEAYSALGGLYIAEGRLASARAQFEAIAQRSPKSVAALTMVGIMFQAEGDVDAARARFERVLQIDPEAAVAANNLAWIYAERGGNLDIAMHLAQVAQKRLPGVAEVSDTLGFIYYKKDLTSLAISTLKVSVEREPGNAMYQYHLGLAYASGGDGVRAKQSLERALTLQPDFSGAGDARERLASLRVR